jgi:hypothetical protein
MPRMCRTAKAVAEGLPHRAGRTVAMVQAIPDGSIVAAGAEAKYP